MAATPHLGILMPTGPNTARTRTKDLKGIPSRICGIFLNEAILGSLGSCGCCRGSESLQAGIPVAVILFDLEAVRVKVIWNLASSQE